jgi:hypothetical protein
MIRAVLLLISAVAAFFGIFTVGDVVDASQKPMGGLVASISFSQAVALFSLAAFCLCGFAILSLLERLAESAARLEGVGVRLAGGTRSGTVPIVKGDDPAPE